MGPLQGVRIIELAGLAPGSHCGMMLADMGARVIRVERKSAGESSPPPLDPLLRNRRSIALNLKHPEGVEVFLRLTDGADALFEGFRPGVTERLGIGPEICFARNPRLVYGRLTGWGQDGPLARAAGHDINYIALSGALHAIGPHGGRPVPPLNLVGDFGGGGLLMAFGIVCALLEARRTGKGQIVDATMLDGALSQMAMSFGMLAAGQFPHGVGESALAGAAPYYDTYETADGRFVAIGALEPQFFRLLLDLTGIPAEDFADAGIAELTDLNSLTEGIDTSKWPELRQRLDAVFRSKTRDEWCAALEGRDVCFAPVLSLAEVRAHEHIQARRAVLDIENIPQNAPAPRFGNTPAGTPAPPRRAGEDTDQVLSECGYSDAEIRRLREAGAVG